MNLDQIGGLLNKMFYEHKIDEDTIDVSFEKSGEKKVKSNYLFSKDNMP